MPVFFSRVSFCSIILCHLVKNSKYKNIFCQEFFFWCLFIWSFLSGSGSMWEFFWSARRRAPALCVGYYQNTLCCSQFSLCTCGYSCEPRSSGCFNNQRDKTADRENIHKQYLTISPHTQRLTDPSEHKGLKHPHEDMEANNLTSFF